MVETTVREDYRLRREGWEMVRYIWDWLGWRVRSKMKKKLGIG